MNIYTALALVLSVFIVTVGANSVLGDFAKAQAFDNITQALEPHQANTSQQDAKFIACVLAVSVTSSSTNVDDNIKKACHPILKAQESHHVSHT